MPRGSEGADLPVEARREGIVLIAALVISVILASILALSAGEEAKAVSRGQTAYVDVQAATLWSKPYQARRYVDRPSYADRTNLTAWERNMSQRQEHWLTGRTQTQALYGQEVRVLRTYGRWAKVALRSQRTPKHRVGYPGWMPAWQLTTRRNADISRRELFVQVQNKYGILYHDRGLDRVDHSVSFGTRLPATAWTRRKVRVADPDGGHLWMRRSQVMFYREGRVRLKAKPTPRRIRYEAMKFRGTPYVWAGTASYGLDCSGFTHQVYRRFGIDIPRDAGDQRAAGSPVGWRNKRPGDLIFFGSSPSRITHEAMYIGGGKMIHAAYSNRRVRVESIWNSGRMDEYQGVRRLR